MRWGHLQFKDPTNFNTYSATKKSSLPAHIMNKTTCPKGPFISKT